MVAIGIIIMVFIGRRLWIGIRLKRSNRSSIDLLRKRRGRRRVVELVVVLSILVLSLIGRS